MDISFPTVRVQLGKVATTRADLVVVPVGSDGVRDAVRRLGRQGRSIGRRVAAVEFRAKPDESLLHHGDAGGVLLLGMGADAGTDAWRKVGARARREAERSGARRLAIALGAATTDVDVVTAVLEGALLVGYRFDRYKAESKPTKVGAITLVGDAVPAVTAWKAAVARATTLVTMVFHARNVVNEPPSVATPALLAAHAEQLAVAVPGLKAEVWSGRRLEREEMRGLLAVARGSRETPRFIQLRYAPANAVKRVALVGKGITFDSGGLSLKPAKSMETMKYDMAGAATVLSAVAAAAQLGLPVAVTAYAPATENLPGDAAQKPGDVIRFMNGKTAEVLNTDAEGRLILADALALAAKSKPDVIVDLATLTGAARVALGASYAAVLGNRQHVVDALVAAGRSTGELVWQLPLAKEYRDDIKSPIADVKNVGGGEAGTITAALFLEEFVADVPWAHLDIAGPAFAEREGTLGGRGATGWGVRLLIEWLQRLAAS